MALKLFTNKFKGNTSDNIAINPTKVINVFESTHTDPETNSISTAVTVYCMTGVHYQVEESFEEVVARFNEKD
jgi:hypothetical protein